MKSLNDGIDPLSEMIKDCGNKIEEITESMGNTHAMEMLRLIRIKKSYEKKVEEFGKDVVDYKIRISKLSRKRKARLRYQTFDLKI